MPQRCPCCCPTPPSPPRPRPRGQGKRQLLEPDSAPGVQLRGEHLALIRGGEHHAVVHRGPQPQALHHLLLGAADVLIPELLDRQRLREIDQSRRRFYVFVLAATSHYEQRREGQGKQ